MSIYFQYPSIEDYPVFSPSIVETTNNEATMEVKINLEQLQELHDYLNLKSV